MNKKEQIFHTLKEYNYWKLVLHEHQYPFIGRCVAWAKRENADLITDMNKEERDELFDNVIKDWERAVNKLYSASRINMAILGNTIPHLHAHLVPRYKEPKKFHGE